MLRISGDAPLGKLLSEGPVPPELTETIENSLKTTDKAYPSVSQELSLGESGKICLRAHTSPVQNDVGEIMGTVTILQDISSLKELEQMKSDFIAMVAHELRAPIAVVEQQLSVILNRMAGELTGPQEELVSRAKERTRGVLNLIKDLLDLSKIEAGKMVQYKEPLVLQEVIQRVVELLKPEAEGKRIDLQFQPLPQALWVSADRNSMEEVFTNLLSNAIKYTPEGGKVRVTLSEACGFVKAKVSDTGIGIKGEDLQRIFDKFYRVKSAETRRIIGTGLGLYIVKSIVDAHLGTISVESEVGKGTTFTLLFPKESKPFVCQGEKS
jgi:signal transduction histidine kinase